MYLLFSGEGPTDLGIGVGDKEVCEGEAYQCGPLALIVDQIMAERHRYSLMDAFCCGFVPKNRLLERVAGFRPPSKSAQLWGKKRPQETIYFYRNARALALYAKDKQQERNDKVVAILFRDSDDSASAERGMWRHKRDSMLGGFGEEEFATGVPMIPKPTSEAWMICALKEHPYQACSALEDRPGKSNAPDSLKTELEEILGEHPSRSLLCELVQSGRIDYRRIDMSSFNAFRARLEEVW